MKRPTMTAGFLLFPLAITATGCRPGGPLVAKRDAENGPASASFARGRDLADVGLIEEWLALMNSANLDLMDDIFAPDFVAHIPNYPQVTGIESYAVEVASAAAVVPEFHTTLEDLFSQGDQAVGRFTATGVMPTPAGGVPYVNTWIIIFRFEDGRIAEEWWQFDLLGVQQQLGALPATRTTYTWGEPSPVGGDPGRPAQNVALARRAEQVWNTGNRVLAEKVFAPDFVNHDPVLPTVTDLESYEGFVTLSRTAFPDLHVRVERVIAAGDRVAVRRTVSGTQEGEFMGHPASGRKMRWTGVTIYRIAGGRIVESWWAYDALGFLMQLTGS